MSEALTCFFNELHSDKPASPEVYVDWQHDLGLDDVKDVLLTQLQRARQTGLSTQVLVTGQKGSGKSTELNRVRERLIGQNVFVSYEDGSFIEAFSGDVTASDILYFAAERLVKDLTAFRIVDAGVAWEGFWTKLKEPLKNLGIDLTGPGGFGIGLSLRNETARRSELRKLFDKNRSKFIDMVNAEVLTPAKSQLQEAGFTGITLLMDGLGDIPLRAIDDPLVAVRTNHEQIFIEQGDVLAGLSCDVVYTFPIELAYQGLRLGSQAGGEAQEIGIIPIIDRSGKPDEAGRTALRRMLERRAEHCGASLNALVAGADVERVISASGGHIRTLFELIQAGINRAGQEPTLPLTGRPIENAIIRRADTLQKGLLRRHREVLDQVGRTQRPPEDELRQQFTELLFSQHILAFFDDRGTWYGVHPLTESQVLAE
jgi:hypothetical protein